MLEKDVQFFQRFSVRHHFSLLAWQWLGGANRSEFSISGTCATIEIADEFGPREAESTTATCDGNHGALRIGALPFVL